MPVSSSGAPPLNGNLLLRNLGNIDQALVLRHLDEIDVPSGSAVIHADEALEAVFFPTAGLVSLEATAGRDHSVEIGVVGREGLLGWPALLGAERSSHRATVRMGGGTLLRIGVKPLQLACQESPTLRAALLKFVNVIFVQMSCAIASHLTDPLGQRIARWLLMRHDRVAGDILLAQHDEIAESLNVRRASITDQLHLLEGLALIRCKRGRIIIRDRAELEAFATNAYGVAEEQYRSLIAPFGKTIVRERVLIPSSAGAPAFSRSDNPDPINSDNLVSAMASVQLA